MNASSKSSNILAHRRRQKQRGFVRVEVRLHQRDVALVRQIASALTDEAKEAETRTFLSKQFGATPPGGLKALLAAAPLDGIDLERDRDTGRAVDL